MKFSTLLDILIELLSKRRLTASYLAEKYELSPRTVYRYVEILSKTVPIQIKRGRNGGVYLSDNYKLPFGFLTAEEYDATITALNDAYAQTLDTRFLEAKRKLSSQEKASLQELILTGESEEILLCEESLALPYSAIEKLRLVGTGMRSTTMLELEYEENGKKTAHRIEPHALLFQDRVWHVYAFCHTARAFRMFTLGRILSIVKTEDPFRKRPFERSDILLASTTNTVTARLEISKDALERAQAWLGAETIHVKKGKYIADVIFSNEEAFLNELLSLGADAKIISPPELKSKLRTKAETIAKLYT